jgi:pimeloyl-CoA dehydrogenase
MDFNLSQTQRDFQREVRDFIDQRLPQELRRKMRLGHAPNREDIVSWQRALNERGWAAPHWPRRYGGAELGTIEKILLQEQLYRAPAPQPLAFNVTMLGPVLMRFGSQQMQDEWLPKLANLDVWFCQGFSEPNSGSDLASLQTSAVREGDHYVVNGQKIWTTNAQWADWIFCLVRTSREARKQDGISMLLFDLKTPGVTIRPIHSIDGHHHLNEVFFDNVRVPATNLVGEEGKGWDCTRFLLGNERTNLAKVGYCYERLDRARELLRLACLGAMARHRVEDKLARLEAETRALEMIQWRMVALEPNDPRAATLASVLKLKGTELQQQIASVIVQIEGTDSITLSARGDAPTASTTGSYHMYSRASTIYGGASEIQKDLLSRGIF